MANLSLKALRLNRGLGVDEAAAQIGVPPHVIRDAETQGTRPRPASALRIAKFYGHTVTELWPLEEAA